MNAERRKIGAVEVVAANSRWCEIAEATGSFFDNSIESIERANEVVGIEDGALSSCAAAWMSARMNVEEGSMIEDVLALREQLGAQMFDLACSCFVVAFQQGVLAERERQAAA